MNQNDRVVLELSADQAKTVEQAMELLFRLHIGQFDQIKWALMCRRDERMVGSDSFIDAALHSLQSFFYPKLLANESFNVNCCEECNTAYAVYQAIRYVNAWHRNPDGSIGVAFDPPMYTGVPIPKCYLVKEGESHEIHA